ncbi:insulin-like growth factor-binding protein complex acid labile subunit isoform X1 [Drosophila novamexicana]|uniref:insulin-like growth factor-binding protein complex acid labile subunit isoform X1 n=1 Tax=Drosophila novamexicana TaxID=47314 RepID=UPI0011E5915A|nr:insulin-like growth factor-binding protein complex acid labile subunit isoform X1 [Drosophila novamexicana]
MCRGMLLKVPLLLLPLLLACHAESLQLTNCNATQLSELNDVATLSALSLSNCSLQQQLKNAIFLRFNQLLSLELQHCQLNSLEDYALHGLSRLQRLSLAHNNLSVIKTWSEKPLSALTSLDISFNTLIQLAARSLMHYPQLQQLNLSHNLIEHLEPECFHNLSHLKHLMLHNNRLQLIAASYFHGLHRLSSLTLQHNLLGQVEPAAFESNTHLRTLRLEQNHLRDLQFLKERGLARLVYLNLSRNSLENLSAQEFSKNFELQHLDLSYNQLKEVNNESLIGLESLERLNISHNIVSHIDTDGLQPLSALLQLDMSFNLLSSLPAELFHANSQLKDINFAHNQLRELHPALLHQLMHLKQLNLAQNHLEDASWLQHLAPALNRLALRVDLSSNRLQSLNLSSLLFFEHVQLADNRWNCSWLVRHMLRTPPASLNFARSWPMLSAWSVKELLNIQGVDCFDDQQNRSIVLLDVGAARLEMGSNCDCDQEPKDELATLTPPLTWPKIRTDRFDSRSVIIWMLVAIALAFAGLRWGQRFMDRKERSRKLQKVNDHHPLNKVELEAQRLRNDRERS